MAAMDTLSLRHARRIALAAQGFTDPQPGGPPDVRHLRRVLRRVGLLQMDSVNVLMRAHYMPLYSRLGPYPVSLIDRAAYRGPRELFEYWGHEASLLPVGLHPVMRWRMARGHSWGPPSRLAKEKPELIKRVLEEVRERGPVAAAEIDDPSERVKHFNWGWNWNEVKTALEYLFFAGEVTAAARNSAWARLYDVPERVLPAAVLNAPTPPDDEAFRDLVRISAAGLGVAAEPELRDYFRLPLAAARTAIAELVSAGELRPVRVEGWKAPAYLYEAARIPRRVTAATLISPFDPLIWERGRVERLFGFSYRIEIYVPAPLRVHGYYVLPFLLNDRFAARVDLKADRKAGVLRVPAAWLEPATARTDPSPAEVASALAAELRRLAGWLGLSGVEPPVLGDLARELTAELAAQSRPGLA
ncbi:winged helix-turn-helix domain-containing protein [Virgisporangium ochraceum]|uniref:winged helix-turn-helix domain-containing protein n=1 Tax=Virgisporangium ochraceum TaxID=65505 RepID=UPI001945B013|nr:crosslink repair DNA glycosylase YcaQ family protein [Virgisporangium ochraceum]